MSNTTTVSFELVTAVGVVTDTFDTEGLARKRLQERKANLPGATIQRVTVTTVRESVYRPRLAVVA